MKLNRISRSLLFGAANSYINIHRLSCQKWFFKCTNLHTHWAKQRIDFHFLRSARFYLFDFIERPKATRSMPVSIFKLNTLCFCSDTMNLWIFIEFLLLLIGFCSLDSFYFGIFFAFAISIAFDYIFYHSFCFIRRHNIIWYITILIVYILFSISTNAHNWITVCAVLEIELKLLIHSLLYIPVKYIELMDFQKNRERPTNVKKFNDLSVVH